MVTGERVSSTTMLLRQIGEISLQITQLCQAVGEVKSMLQSVEERVRKLENTEAGQHPLIQSQINTAWTQIEDHGKRLITLENVVTQLKQSNGIMTWLAGILGSAVIIWLVTQILQVIK